MSTPTIRRLSTREPEFLSTLDALLAFDNSTDEAIEKTVAEILAHVRTLGDAAVLDYTRRFDHLDARAMIELELPGDELKAAFDGLPVAQRDALAQVNEQFKDLRTQRVKVETDPKARIAGRIPLDGTDAGRPDRLPNAATAYG